MSETLKTVALLGAGSVIWFGVQTAVWFVGIGRFCARESAERLISRALVVFPLFTLAAEGLRLVAGLSTGFMQLALGPVMVAWVLLVSWGGLRLAVRLKGPPPSATGARPGTPPAHDSEGRY